MGNRVEIENIIKATIQALVDTFKGSTKTESTPGKIFARGTHSLIDVDIVAVVGIFSAPFSGSVILGFPEKTYITLMSRLLSQECSSITPEIRDGAAELLNMILGQAKLTLHERGFDIQQAIPTVVQGSQLQILPSKNKPSVVVQISTDAGDLYLEVTGSLV